MSDEYQLVATGDSVTIDLPPVGMRAYRHPDGRYEITFVNEPALAGVTMTHAAPALTRWQRLRRMIARWIYSGP